MSNSLNLELPYVQGNQSQKHVTVNDAFRRIDSIVQLTVEDRNRATPPASPVEGDRHIVSPSASGAWAGHPLEVAAYQDGAWIFFEPKEGWVAYNIDEEALLYFDGSDWEILTAVGASEVVGRLGVNTTADDTNRLTVQSEAALFTADTTQSVPTGDMRVKVNKTGEFDTAAHLFQRNFSGRAEFGLLGSDDFSLKVSPDGSTWTEALSVDADTAQVDFAAVPAVGGEEAFVVSYPHRNAAASAQIPSDVVQIEVRGYASENDGGLARYRRVGSLPSDGLGFGDAAGGFWSFLGDTVSVRQTGAVGNSIADDTAALQRAFLSGRNVFIESGIYYVTDAIPSGGPNQRIVGEGRGNAVLRVDAAFNMSAAGVIRLDHDYTALREFTINFDQTGVTSRAALRQYPPAVYMVNETRCRLTGLRFQAAWDGILATGNCGGAIFDDIECGSFNVGIRLGGSLDTVELRNCRIWPYEFAADTALLNIFSDGNNVGFRIGRVDDLKMVNCTPFRTRMIFEASDGFKPFGTVTGLALDGSQSSIDFQDGEITFSSLYATTNDPNDTFITQTGGVMAISDFSFKVSSGSNAPLVWVNNVAAVCLIQNGNAVLGPNPAVEGFRVSAGKLTVSSVNFGVDPAGVRTGPCIRQIGGQLIAFGNSVNGNTTGSGPFIRVQTDGNHVIVGNDSNGWGFELPAGQSAGLYGPNHNGSRAMISSNVTFARQNNAQEGGEFRLEGAGSASDISFDNFDGNARVFTLQGNRSLQVISTNGVARLSGSSLSFSNGLRVDKGSSNEVGSTAVGDLALSAVVGGTSNTAVGRQALQVVTGGDQNTAIGNSAGRILTLGNQNTFCGMQAGENKSSGTGSTLIGFRAGRSITSGGGNTAVGRNALNGGVGGGVANASALGEAATVTGSNQVQLGNSATTTFAYGSVQNRSDIRDKADVRDTVLGLDFINALRPVDYRWNYREDYPGGIDGDDDASQEENKRTRFHHGFIAQDIARWIDETGVDFGGYQDHARAGGLDVKSLGYTELIAPLVKAVQQISERLDAIDPPATA